MSKKIPNTRNTALLKKDLGQDFPQDEGTKGPIQLTLNVPYSLYTLIYKARKGKWESDQSVIRRILADHFQIIQNT